MRVGPIEREDGRRHRGPGNGAGLRYRVIPPCPARTPIFFGGSTWNYTKVFVDE